MPHPSEPSKSFTSIEALMQAIALLRTLINHYLAQRQHLETPSPEAFDPQTLDQAMAAAPTLQTLGAVFGLSRFEGVILLCCAAQALYPDIGEQLAIAHQNPETPYLTFQLACQCFPDPHWDAILDHRPLRRWQLLHNADTPEIPRARLQIDEAILHYLMDQPYHDPVLSSVCTPLANPATDPLQPSHRHILNQIVAVLGNGENSSPLIQLCGTYTKIQTAIAAHVGQHLGLSLYRLPSDAIPSDRADLQRLILRWQRWYALNPSLLIVDAQSVPVTAERARPPLIDAFLETVNVPVLVSTETRLSLSHPAVITFEVEGLLYAEQLQLWQQAWPPEDDASRPILAQLASQFRLSAAMIRTACATIQSESPASTPETRDRLWNFCRRQARPQLEALAQRINVQSTWDDLVLPERETAILHQITTHVRQQAKVYQQWGFSGKTQRGLGLSVLFAGASGTGKTTAAEILANELHLDLFRIDLSAVMSKFIGETEKNLRRIFDAAEVGGAILLFDEADALFGKRTQVKDSHDRHANIEVSYLLQRMETYQGLAILTTNLKDNLDQAFLRRLRFVLNFPYPKTPERQRIWQRAFPPQTPLAALDYGVLAELDITGGVIKAIALNAAFLAADANEPVTMQHLLSATQTEFLKEGRSLSTIDRRDWEDTK
ncbi:ATP-binding protein [Spirulina major]|uniref:ATP-binding protein n=1 Tax=Spirulina major TaxID=270636 RepID=UPI0009344D84|nr:ATP-binding protein [Spirulina major]